MDTYLSIGQATKILNCSESMLRFYESEFSLFVVRNASNRRMYTKKNLDKLKKLMSCAATVILSGRSNAALTRLIKKILESQMQTLILILNRDIAVSVN